MEIRQLQQFVVLAETLNFRAAAERLFMSQPPLSVSIRKLEDEIGVKLFSRTTHAVQLTREGEAVLESARQTLFHAQEVARIARSTAAGLSGILRIGFVGSAKNALLPKLLPSFRDNYPNVVMTCTEESNTWIISALEQHRIDVGIVRVPLTRRSQIEYLVIERDRFVAALPARHPLTAKHDLTLADLAEQPFIHYTANVVPGLHSLVSLLFEEAGIFPRVAQEAVQVQTVLFLVASGLGVALVPGNAALRSLENVVFRSLAPLPGQASIGLALAFNPNYETAVAKRFRELAEAQSGEPSLPPAPGRIPR
ncbi:DNA-binding transcriptional regulator, LysR family [Pseudomonas flavescens]|uniref:DNA-binding transcriptional regulator, LysR family n=1 Tax=Phytopseudomonas flavescens TaxID=29435 RepID=A0A1G7Y4A4_9GAMM|nr:LysR family transcriptional regulator [Pseudomonas flavescens]SDG91261.1 DNA-binding transcriptional regulator, LysR family [Pseudomonas flavescens]